MEKQIKFRIQRNDENLLSSINSLEQMFRPNDAMNWLRWCITNGASGKCSLCCFWCALIALGQSFLDQFDLTVVASGSALNERNIGRQTHAIDMVASLSIIQGIQNNIEFLEKSNPVLCSVGEIEQEFSTIYIHHLLEGRR